MLANANSPASMLLKKAIPSLQEFFQTVEDPDLLHEVFSEMIVKFNQVLEADHDRGYGGADLCQCPSTSQSEPSVPSGDDGHREINLDGNDDEGVPDALQSQGGQEESGEDSDNRYEAEVQSTVGDEWVQHGDYPTLQEVGVWERDHPELAYTGE